MADPVTKLELENASVDAKTLEDVANGDEDTVVTSRLGQDIKSLANAIEDITGQASTIVGYATQALLFADTGQNATAVGYVNADPVTANNGYYLSNGAGGWNQSNYDRVSLVEADMADIYGSPIDTNNLIGINVDIHEGYSVSDIDGALAVRSQGTIFTPVAVTALEDYYLSNRKTVWQAGDVISWFNYTGSTPGDIDDFIANSTLIDWEKMFNGLFVAPTGANYVIVGIDHYYNKTLETIKETNLTIKLEQASEYNFGGSQLINEHVTDRKANQLDKAYNKISNGPLQVFRDVEDEDFNTVSLYRKEGDPDYYSYVRPQTDPYLAGRGVINKVGFADATEFITHSNDSQSRRINPRFWFATPLKKVFNKKNFVMASMYLETDQTDDIVFFSELTGNHWVVAHATTVDEYTLGTTEMRQPDLGVDYTTVAEPEMIVGKMYAYGDSFGVTKIKTGLYKILSFVVDYDVTTSTTALESVSLGAPYTKALRMAGSYLLSGFSVYLPDLEEGYTKVTPSEVSPNVLAPLQHGVNMVAERTSRTETTLQDILSGNWFGKTMCWLGTSVPNEPPFGEVGTKKYPEFVSDIMKCGLVNKSLGGSILIWDPANSRYGLAGSAAEFVAEGQPETSSQGAWDTQLSPYWDSDLFVFDHGHNDAGKFDSWFTDGVLTPIDGTNAFDRTWMVGAFNYVIREIYKHNPRARIIIINDWRAEYYDNKPACQMVADYWGIPIINMRMGNANIDMVTDEATTYTTYDGVVTPISAGTTVNPLKYQTKAAPDDATPSPSDTIHPGRFGRIAYAKKIAKFIALEVDPEDTTGYY